MYYLGMCSALLWQLAEEGRSTGSELESLQWKFGNKFATQKNFPFCFLMLKTFINNFSY